MHEHHPCTSCTCMASFNFEHSVVSEQSRGENQCYQSVSHPFSHTHPDDQLAHWMCQQIQLLPRKIRNTQHSEQQKPKNST